MGIEEQVKKMLREEARMEGLKEGSYKTFYKIVRSLLHNGKTPQEISELLDEDLSLIGHIAREISQEDKK